MRIAGIVE